ncbi:efflux RND transporter periplasmic adaptor subunit [Pseudothioclava nitratireducens]|uniref:efflux RND transporter periplasmic adaptor subunit n=1 Tax=Pseudothioclava nitratireducens TaxID=1928646 RepID=UPI0023D97D2A|nr:efflux RND transporter periplasmic adaptor subunit [Defluviimonas nitratireducens]MDF1619410.1 efflux RND transporter periplasmic adaptor subunit [Defluviimonas nitratireducens]
MNAKILPLALVALSLSFAARAEGPYTVQPAPMTDWKAVYGQVEAKDMIPARARLGGTLVDLSVSEGDQVQAGQPLGRIVDEKIAFQLGAVDAQLNALTAQLENAQAELARGEALLSRGVTTAQQLDSLRTQVNVLEGQIAAQQAQRRVVEQQQTEGEVLAPISGRVLTVPVAKGAVVMAGEPVATIGGGGFFLTLAVPERHAGALTEGDTITIETADGDKEGVLAKVYPSIENGRVVADVDVPDLDAGFVNARVLVRLPMAVREALSVPADLIRTHAGLDFVVVQEGETLSERAIVPGTRFVVDGVEMVEILTGLQGGETVVAHEH